MAWVVVVDESRVNRQDLVEDFDATGCVGSTNFRRMHACVLPYAAARLGAVRRAMRPLIPSFEEPTHPCVVGPTLAIGASA